MYYSMGASQSMSLPGPKVCRCPPITSLSVSYSLPISSYFSASTIPFSDDDMMPGSMSGSARYSYTSSEHSSRHMPTSMSYYSASTIPFSDDDMMPASHYSFSSLHDAELINAAFFSTSSSLNKIRRVLTDHSKESHQTYSEDRLVFESKHLNAHDSLQYRVPDSFYANKEPRMLEVEMAFSLPAEFLYYSPAPVDGLGLARIPGDAYDGHWVNGQCICIDDLSPTTSPTLRPSRRPTVSPTRRPTKIPTFNPTRIPTAMPTRSPTRIPTKMPTGQPTSQPSGKPTRAPISSAPSSQPTAAPSKKPVTAHPTQRGETRSPTYFPTSTPTYDVSNYENKDIYHNYQLAKLWATTNYPQFGVFSTFSYRGRVKDGSNVAWKNFKSSLSLPYDDMYFSGIFLNQTVQAWQSKKTKNDGQIRVVRRIIATCTQREDVLGLVTAISMGKSWSTYCGTSRLFRVFSCEGEVTVCVDCEVVCVLNSATDVVTATEKRLCPGRGSFYRDASIYPLVLNPSVDDQMCFAQVDSYATLSFTIGKDILYPQFTAPIVYVAHKRSVDVKITVDKPGTIFCGKFSEYAAVSSSIQIKQQGYKVMATLNSTQNSFPQSYWMTLKDLVPSARYVVYCYTEDFNNHFMPLDTVVSSYVRIDTLCCKQILWKSKVKSITSGAGAPPTTFSFSLESLPSSTVRLRTTLTSISCDEEQIGVPPVAFTKPDTFVFDPTSTALGGSFIVQGTPGCYNLTIQTTNAQARQLITVNVKKSHSIRVASISDSIEPFHSELVIRNSAKNPNAPVLSLVQFADNPSKIFITFDSDTDMGSQTIVPTPAFPSGYTGLFNCTDLFFAFPGSSNAKCLWTSRSQITVNLGRTDPLAIRSLPQIGDTYTLKAQRLQPICVSRTTPCPWNIQNSVTLIKPINPIQPVVAISTSKVIGECNSIVIDPTGSEGYGGSGRSWTSIVWSVSVLDGAKEIDGRVNQTKINAINTYLNTYGLTTKSLITIPKELLRAPAVYNIQLSLTNFLLQTSTASVKVTKTSVAKQPVVSIIGPSSISVIRSDKVSIFALGTVPVCPGAPASTSSALQYQWTVWTTIDGKPTLLDETMYPQFANKARDKRYYKQNPFVFEPNTDYSVQVVVFIDGQSASQMVAVAVRSAGVVASILGGAVRSSGTSAITTFLSDSYDLDYPKAAFAVNGMNYLWTCIEVSPNYGDDCPNSLDGATTWSASIPAGRFNRPEDATYQIALFVENSIGMSSTTSITITLVSTAIPEVSMNSVAAKYNPTAKTQLSGAIQAEFEGWAQWTSPDFTSSSLEGMMLNSRKVRLKTGINLIGLALKPNVLTPGMKFTFSLSATYNLVDTDRIDKFETITILMNSPPSVGTVDVNPTSGFALDNFYIQISDFTDDAEDLPLQYSLQIYDNPGQVSILKPYSAATYASVQLGQGVSGLNYVRVIAACAKDSFGAYSCSNLNVQVLPVPAANLEAVTSSLLELAVSNSDPSQMLNAVSAAASTLNVLNCTLGVSYSCESIGRHPCETGTVPNTCGVCLPGKIGITGAGMQKCYDPVLVKKNGDSCSSNADCASSFCDGGVCEYPSKSCPAQCSGHGQCVFYATKDDSVLAQCAEGDYGCYASCVCDKDVSGLEYGGSDCSLSNAAFLAARRMRDQLCIAVQQTVALQDPSADVISSRMGTIKSMLRDPSQLSLAGIESCAQALIDTIDSAEDIVGDPSISNDVADALAVTVACPLTSDFLQDIGRVTALYTESIQSQMIANEAPSIMMSATSAMSSQLNTGDVATKAPQNDMDVFNGRPETQIGIEAGTADAIGTSIVQYNNNPTGVSTDATATGVQVVTYSQNIPGLRRRRLMQGLGNDDSLDEDWAIKDFLGRGKPRWRRLSATTSTIVITLQNAEPQSYFVIPARHGNVSCADIHNGQNYNVTVSCEVYSHAQKAIVNESYAFECDMLAIKNFTYVCPVSSKLPTCRFFNGTDFAIDPDCEVVGYSPTNTTCKCIKSAHRRGLGLASAGKTEIVQLSASASIVAKGFMKTINTFNQFTQDDDATGAEKFEKIVNQNTAIFSTTVALLGSLFIGIFGAYFKDFNQTKIYREKQKKLEKFKNLLNRSKSIEEFFNDAMPIEYSGQAWWVRWADKIKVDHDWLGVFLPFKPERGSAMKRFAIGCGKVLHFMFVDTILAGLFFVDDGTCGQFTDESSCTFLSALNQLDSLCVWNFDAAGYQNATTVYGGPIDFKGNDLKPNFESCAFNEDVMGDFISSLVLVTVLSCFIIPLNAFFEYLVNTIEGLYFQVLEKRQQADKIAAAEGVQEHGAGALRMLHSSKVSNGEGEGVNLENERLFVRELFSNETMKTAMLRAARLGKMQAVMDELTAKEEANLLIAHIDEENLDDKLRRVVLHKSEKHGLDFINPAVEYVHGFYLKHDDHGDSEAGAAMVAAERNGHPGLIEHTIVKARLRCNDICEILEQLDDEVEQDKYLVRKFVVESLSGFSRRLTSRYFFGDEERRTANWYQGYFYLFFIVIYVIALSFYIFLFGVSLGASATEMWLIGTGVGFLMDVFVLQPVRIHIEYVMLCAVTQSRVRLVHGILRDRAKGIVQRIRGLMRDAHALVQHINPVCRAARRFPHLPVSRLLMSLNDYDIPVNRLEDDGACLSPTLNFMFKMAAQLVIFGFVFFMLLLFTLPKEIWENVLDAILSIFIGIGVAIFYFFSEISIGAAVGLGVAVLILFAVYEYKAYQSRLATPWKLAKPIPIPEEIEEDESVELILKIKPEVQMYANKSWKAVLMRKVKNNLGSFFSKFNPSVAPGSPIASVLTPSAKKSYLQIKLWPELEKPAESQQRSVDSVPHDGTNNAKRIERAAQRAQRAVVLPKLDALLANEVNGGTQDIKFLFSDSQSLDSTNEIPSSPKTAQDRLGRLNSQAKSSVLSRSALRAVKKEEAAVVAQRSMRGDGSAGPGSHLENVHLNLASDVSLEFNFE